MQADAPAEQGHDHDPVFLWVRHQFVLLGFTRRQASRLADQHSSWHEAEALLAAGCPLDVCFDLLT